MATVISLSDILDDIGGDEFYVECGGCGGMEWRIKMDKEDWTITKVICVECGNWEAPDYDIGIS